MVEKLIIYRTEEKLTKAGFCCKAACSCEKYSYFVDNNGIREQLCCIPQTEFIFNYAENSGKMVNRVWFCKYNDSDDDVIIQSTDFIKYILFHNFSEIKCIHVFFQDYCMFNTTNLRVVECKNWNIMDTLCCIDKGYIINFYCDNTTQLREVLGEYDRNDYGDIVLQGVEENNIINYGYKTPRVKNEC